MARPMPVLPEVGSTMVPPRTSLPLFSASSTIESAIRSLMEPPGLARSDLIQTSAPLKRRARRMWGVLPIVSRTLLAFMGTLWPAHAMKDRLVALEVLHLRLVLLRR